MSLLLHGPSGRFDADQTNGFGTQGLFVDNNPRRPLNAPGADQAWLWHRSNRGEDPVPDPGSTGPTWWEGAHGWGEKKSLARLPRVLVVVSYDEDAARTWINKVFDAHFHPLHVSVWIAPPGTFPYLTGLPFDSIGVLERDGTFKNPLLYPNPIDETLIYGGQLFIASICRYRTQFMPYDGPGFVIPEDYTANSIDDPAFGGYLSFPDSDVNPNDGFTVFVPDALTEYRLMARLADRCRKFQKTFYQSMADYPGAGVGDTDSSLIPDSALDQLIFDRTRVKRKPFTDGDLDSAFAKVLSDAVAFFSPSQ